MQVEVLLDHATLLTMGVGPGPARGADQAVLGLVPDGALAVQGGHIVRVGRREDVLAALEAELAIDLGGWVVLPGFVDAHTHPVWAGSRAAELEMRVQGATYLDIMAAGGGIASTVRATRAAADEDLVAATLGRLDQLAGPWRHHRRGQVRLRPERGRGAAAAGGAGRGGSAAPDPGRADVPGCPRPARGVSRPAGRVRRAGGGRNAARRWPRDWPGVFCDVFCDEGAFTLAQTRHILRAGPGAGLGAQGAQR